MKKNSTAIFPNFGTARTLNCVVGKNSEPHAASVWKRFSSAWKSHKHTRTRTSTKKPPNNCWHKKSDGNMITIGINCWTTVQREANHTCNNFQCKAKASSGCLTVYYVVQTVHVHGHPSIEMRWKTFRRIWLLLWYVRTYGLLCPLLKWIYINIVCSDSTGRYMDESFQVFAL